jgi:hypothetical protein
VSVLLNRLTRVDQQTLWSQHYRYDLYQNIEQIRGEQPGAEKSAQPAASAAQTFAYDPLNRLVEEKTRSKCSDSITTRSATA